jgi:PAS domain S-box-containing protein
MRGSFKRQIILAFVVGFFFLITAFAVYLVNREKGNLYRDSLDETTGLAESLAVSSLSWVLANDVAGLQEVVSSFQNYPALRYTMVIAPTGRVLAHSDATKVGQFISDEKSLALLKAHPRTQTIMDNEYMVDVAVPISINNRYVGWARVGLGRGKISDALQRMMLVSGFFVLLSTALSLLAAILIASRLGRRIGSLVKVAEDVQAGNFSTRASIPGGEDEVTKLADTFNQMLDALARDIAERNKAEQEVTQLSLRNRQILDSAGEGIYGLDIEGRCTFVNPAALQLLGFSVEELLGQHSHSVFHHTKPDGHTYPENECPVQAAYKQGMVYRGDDLYWRKDGRNFPVEFISTPILESGTITGAVVAFRDITERKQAEEALRTSEQRYRRAQTIGHVGNWEYNIQTTQFWGSDEAKRMYGFDPEQPGFSTEEVESCIPERERVHQALVDLIEKNKPYDMEFEIRPKGSSELRIISAIADLQRDEHGNPQVVMGVIHDITERKQAEEALRRLTLLQRTILDNVAYGVISTNPDGLVTSFNPAAERMLGYTASEVVGQQTPACWHDSEEIAQHALQLSEELGTPIAAGFEVFAARPRRNLPEENEWTFIRKDGRRIPMNLSVTALRDEGGQVTGFVGLAYDLTERKLAEEQLRRSERGLAEAQRIAHLGNWDLDLVQNVLIWSDEIYRIFEIDPKKFDASYEAFLDAIHPDDRELVNNAYTESVKNKVPYDIEHRLLMKDGRVKYVNEKCETHYDEDGKPLRSVGAVHDITERKRAEEELRRYKDHLEDVVQQRTADLALALDAAEAANRAKSVFLSSMSHELRTPMNAILGFSGMMRKDPLLSQEQRDNLDIINRSGDHLLTLINDVLDMAKIEAGRVQLESAPIDLGVLLRDVTDMMHMRAQEKGLELLIDQSSEFPRYIKGDEMRLRQVLINLIGNAVKFTEHGSITLRLGVESYDGVRHLLIKVEDTGIGIKPEDQLKIFKPFVQLGKMATQTGSGLGLALTQQYLQLMGGMVSVESTLGKGSIFQVKLPLEEVAAADVVAKLGSMENREVVSLAPNQPEYRILIVEDQLDNQLLLTKLMKNVGFQVKVADDGKQAVELFQSWRPHLIWMDRRMPVMDGLEATRRIRELPGGKKVKIVAVTASVMMEQRDEMVHAGMDEFVRKPYRFNEIYECMAKLLGVQYIYADVHEAEEVSDVVLTAEMLAALPPDLRRELHEALESLEDERIAAAMQQIASYDPALHKTLSRLVENFNYPAILKALQTNQAGSVT